NGGNITQTGALTILGTSNIQAGAGSITLTNTGNDFVGGVTAGGSGISFTDVNNFTPTNVVSTGPFSIVAVGQISGPGHVQGTTGTLDAGINNVDRNLDVDSTGATIFTGNATAWNLAPGSAVGAFLVGNTNITVSVDGAGQIVSTALQAASISSSAAQNSASAAAADEAANTFGTDSVAEQVEYGFAGDVGTLPPIDHRLQGVGISVPKCFNESREGDAC